LREFGLILKLSRSLTMGFGPIRSQARGFGLLISWAIRFDPTIYLLTGFGPISYLLLRFDPIMSSEEGVSSTIIGQSLLSDPPCLSVPAPDLPPTIRRPGRSSRSQNISTS
jgi:hypothetical protein